MTFPRRPSHPRFMAISLAPLLSMLLFSCGGPKTHVIYLHGIPTAAPAQSSGLTVGLAPYQDPRPRKQLLGKRIRLDGVEDVIRLHSRSPAEDLTQMTRRLLAARGVRVVELPSWTPEPENLKDLPEGVRMAFRGRIDTMEVEAHSSLWKTSVQYRIRLTAHVGDKEKGEVLTRTIESSPQESYVGFDPAKIEDRLNDALSGALDRLLEGIVSRSSQVQ